MPNFVVLALGVLLGLVLAAFFPRSVAELKRISNFFLFNRKRRLQFRFFKLLDNLLRDNDDAAVDAFIRGVQPNAETLETHLSLAAFYRRRGEFQRAVRIHENLLRQEESLSFEDQQRVSFELAEDYMVSGLLDRAETLFRELAQSGKLEEKLRRQTFERLVEIYQLTRDWLAAIDYADQLTESKFDHSPDIWRSRQAHFSCEIADAAIAVEEYEEARSWLKKAVKYDTSCDRAHIVLADLAVKQDDWAEFNRHQSELVTRHSKYYKDFFVTHHRYIEQHVSAVEIESMLVRQFEYCGSLTLLQYLADYNKKNISALSAMNLILKMLERYPSYKRYSELMQTLLGNGSVKGKSELHYESIKGILTQLAEQYDGYSCQECGFIDSQLQWKCPSCKQWGTMQPKSPELFSQPMEVVN
jgi:lipopolysaccharide biosynthesis regulator YciM